MNKDSYASNLVRSLRNRGIFGTLKFLWYELVFDLKYEVRTLGRKSLDGLTVKGVNIERGHAYQGYSYLYFAKVISQLPVDFGESVFIDIGSGKGRILIMAAECGFKRIIGVEFIAEFYEACLRNIKKYGMNEDKIEVVFEDAASWVIPDDANVLCFYNPFDAHIMDLVLNNVKQSKKANPRDIYLVYLSPLFSKCFVDKGYENIYEFIQGKKVEAIIYKN